MKKSHDKPNPFGRQKSRSFLAILFAAGDLRRLAFIMNVTLVGQIAEFEPTNGN
jgi:hypothetical protein